MAAAKKAAGASKPRSAKKAAEPSQADGKLPAKMPVPPKTSLQPSATPLTPPPVVADAPVEVTVETPPGPNPSPECGFIGSRPSDDASNAAHSLATGPDAPPLQPDDRTRAVQPPAQENPS